MLALQHFCESRGLEYLVNSVDHAWFDEEWVGAHPAVAPLVELLNGERFVDFSLLDGGVLVDRAADGCHPGPASNEIFARRMWDRFERPQSQEPPASIAARRRRSVLGLGPQLVRRRIRRQTCTVQGGHEDVTAVNPRVRACIDDFRRNLSFPARAAIAAVREDR
jgi:hypothetical protein